MAVASELNKDLDDYLSKRRKHTDWHLFRPKHKHVEGERGVWERLFSNDPEPVDEGLHPEEREHLEEIEHEIEHIDEEERAHPERRAELEERRESLFSRFTGFFRQSQQRHRLEEEAEELELEHARAERIQDEEVKRVLKATHKWLGKLSEDEKNAFKRSQDFEEYKRLLQKYGLAK